MNKSNFPEDTQMLHVYIFISGEHSPLKSLEMDFLNLQVFHQQMELFGLNCDNFGSTDDRLKYKLKSFDLALVKKNDDKSNFEAYLTFQ